MVKITPPKLPNQKITVKPGGVTYVISLRYFRGLMYATVRNMSGNVHSGMVRCTNGGWILPWRKLGVGDGNFRFEDEQGRYPNFENFGDGCYLAYYTSEEIEAGDATEVGG